MHGFFSKLILPLIVVIVAVCGLLARNNAEQWERFYGEAQSLYDDGRYEESLEAAITSLERTEGWLGLSATYKSDSLNLIGLSLDELERYEEAEAAYRRALQIEERAWGKEGNPDYAVVLDNFAMSCDTQERYEEAVVLAREALEIWEGMGDVRRIHSLSTLISALCNLEDYEQAALYAQMAVQVLETEWPDNEVRLVNALHWEGDIYYMLDRYEEAEAALLRAFGLALRVALSDVVDLVDCTADVFLAQSKLTETEALYLQAIEFLEQLPRGEAVAVAEDGTTDWEHPDVLLSRILTNFGGLYMDIDAYDKAVDQYRRVSELDARIYGEEHLYVVIGLNDLGVALELGGSYAQAEEAYLRALAILEKWEEPDSDMQFVVLQNLADTYGKGGQLQKLAETKIQMNALIAAAEEEMHPVVVAPEGGVTEDDVQTAVTTAGEQDGGTAAGAAGAPAAVPSSADEPAAKPPAPVEPALQ